MKIKCYLVWAAMMLVAIPVWGQESDTSSSRSDIGWNGWGLRAGLASDPDQIVGGVQFDLGEFRPNLRFRPDVQLGLGDDVTTLYVTAPVHFRFNVQEAFTPYAGGGVALGLVDRDLPPTSTADETSFEIGFRATGGLEWNRRGTAAFAVELSLGFGDVPDAQIVAVWNFDQ